MSEPRPLIRFRKLCLALPEAHEVAAHVCDWGELADILRDAHRLVAPKRLVAQLDEPQAGRRLA